MFFAAGEGVGMIQRLPAFHYKGKRFLCFSPPRFTGKFFSLPVEERLSSLAQATFARRERVCSLS
jgi:hypothetical protein